MKEDMKKEIIYQIESLNISKELRDKLLDFNEKLNHLVLSSCSVNPDIIIDNMSQKNIKTLLKYIKEILKKYHVINQYFDYDDEPNIQDIKNSCIVITNFYKFYNDIIDHFDRKKYFNSFYSDIKNRNNIIIFTYTNRIGTILNEFDSNLFNHKLCIHLTKNQTEKDLYDDLIKRYKKNKIASTLSFNTFKKIVQSINAKDIYFNYNIIDFLYDHSIKKMIIDNSKTISNKTFSDLIKKEEKKKISSINLDDLIGLSNVKSELNRLYKYLNFKKKLKINENIYLSLLFLGNPGTGKTTVARIYADKLYEMGFISENKLVEVTPNDLIGEYVGQTKKKMDKLLKDATGGVLFIDEAYLLFNNNYKSGNNPYMEEAIVELIKYLENPKNIVIFAGYTNETRNIYNANPGIKSRIYGELLFDDYSSLELYEILEKEFTKQGLKLDSKSKIKIINCINNLKTDKDFGNARSIKQLAQKMIINHAECSDSLMICYKDLPKLDKIVSSMGVGIYDR